MFTLIAMGTGVAYVYSLIGNRRARYFSRRPFAGMTARLRCISKQPPLSPSSSCLARFWNCAPRAATSGAIKALLELAPKTARFVDENGADHEVPIDSLKVGDRLRVPAGRKSAGGRCHPTKGRSTLDEIPW